MRLMTTVEVAELYRTSPETVRYWRSIGYGPPGRKVGRKVLYESTEVEAFWSGLKASDTRTASSKASP